MGLQPQLLSQRLSQQRQDGEKFADHHLGEVNNYSFLKKFGDFFPRILSQCKVKLGRSPRSSFTLGFGDSMTTEDQVNDEAGDDKDDGNIEWSSMEKRPGGGGGSKTSTNKLLCNIEHCCFLVWSYSVSKKNYLTNHKKSCSKKLLLPDPRFEVSPLRRREKVAFHSSLPLFRCDHLIPFLCPKGKEKKDTSSSKKHKVVMETSLFFPSSSLIRALRPRARAFIEPSLYYITTCLEKRFLHKDIPVHIAYTKFTKKDWQWPVGHQKIFCL